MNNRYSLLFALPFLCTVAVLYITNTSNEKDKNTAHYPINSVIGDESYVAFFGEKPYEDASDQVRIRTHLLYVEKLLRERPKDHLSPEQKKNRAHYLDLLRAYIQAGQFPHNDGHPDPRRPTFIDEDGNICAVGYLLEQTAGRQVAKSVNKKYKYAFITEIDNQAFKEWVQKSGFSFTELAMIQPAYEPEDKTIKNNRNHMEPSYTLGSSILASTNVLYLSNRSGNPWFFSSPKVSHWFGLAAGTGSVLLGTLNIDNRTSGSQTVCGFTYPCWEETHIETNHLRTGVSIANIGVGLVNVVRATYHLLKAAENESKKPGKTEFALTHMQPSSASLNEAVPALSFQYNF